MVSTFSNCTNAFNDVHSKGDHLIKVVTDYSASLTKTNGSQALLGALNKRTRTVSCLVHNLDTADNGVVYEVSPMITTGQLMGVLQTNLKIINDRDPAALYGKVVKELNLFYYTVKGLSNGEKTVPSSNEDIPCDFKQWSTDVLGQKPS
jgi:hypothetical protein